MTSVFISHSSLDHELVGKLIVDLLEQHGLDVWYSRDSIHAAEEWEKRIRQALVASDWFLVALSANSVHSEWVRAEVDWALENRRGKLVPVLIGDCDPQDCHLRLRQIQYIDLRRGNPTATTELLRVWNLAPAPRDEGALSNGPHQGRPSRSHGGTVPVAPPPMRAKRANRLFWLAGSAFVLVLAILAWIFFHSGTGSHTEQQNTERNDASAGKITQPPSTLRAVTKSETPAPPPVFVEIGLANPSNETQPQDPSRDVQVTYHFDRHDQTLTVGYHLPYLERQRAGQLINGLSFFDVPFDWDFPVLSVKIHNNSAQSVMITECIVQVAASRVDSEPVLVVADGTLNGLLITNEGWGDVVDPVLTFKILSTKNEVNPALAAVERHSLELKTFAEECRVPLRKYVPKEIDKEPEALVSGDLELGPPGRRKKIPFTTTMAFENRSGAPIPPSYVYDLSLNAGKAPDTVRVPVSHNLKPGDSDQFHLRVASDKSAHYELKFVVRSIDGREFAGQNVVLDVFIPRSVTKRVEKSQALGAPARDKSS